MTLSIEPESVGGESHGSIAWSLFIHFHVPMLDWVGRAILLVALIGLIAGFAALVAPRRFGRSGRVLVGALAVLGPLLGVLGAAMALLKGAIDQIDFHDTVTCSNGPDPVAVGVAAVILILGLLAGVIGVVLRTALALIDRTG